MSDDVRVPERAKTSRQWPIWTPLFGGLALVLLGVLAIGAFVLRSGGSEPISQLETTLFTVLLFVESTVGSILVASYYGRQQARDRYVELAKPAWRRVKNLSRSSSEISGAISSKQSIASQAGKSLPTPVVVEWLDSFQRLVDQHSGQLEDAVSDWQELLPEEFAQLSRERAEIERTRADVAATLAELVASQREAEQAQAEGSAQAEAEVVRLSGELARLKVKLDEMERRQYNPYTTVNVGSTALVSGLEGIKVGNIKVPTISSESILSSAGRITFRSSADDAKKE